MADDTAGRGKRTSNFVFCPRCEKYRPVTSVTEKGICLGCLKPPERIAFAAEQGRIRLYEDSPYRDTKLARKANRAILEHGGVVEAARALNVNHGVISRARKGISTPAALKAFNMPPDTVEVSPDMVLKRPRRPDKKKRHRSHVEHGRGPDGLAHKRQMHAWLSRNGWDSLSEAVESLMEVE